MAASEHARGMRVDWNGHWRDGADYELMLQSGYAPELVGISLWLENAQCLARAAGGKRVRVGVGFAACPNCDMDYPVMDTDGDVLYFAGPPCPNPGGFPSYSVELELPTGRLATAPNLETWFPVAGDRRCLLSDLHRPAKGNPWVERASRHGFFPLRVSLDEVEVRPGWGVCSLELLELRCRSVGLELADVPKLEVHQREPGCYRLSPNSPPSRLGPAVRPLPVVPPGRISAHAFVRSLFDRYPTLYAPEEAQGLLWEELDLAQQISVWCNAGATLFRTLGNGIYWHPGGFPYTPMDFTLPDTFPFPAPPNLPADGPLLPSFERFRYHMEHL